MATTISRPDGTVSAGNWSVVDADIPGVLNDADDATIVFNTNAIWRSWFDDYKRINLNSCAHDDAFKSLDVKILNEMKKLGYFDNEIEFGSIYKKKWYKILLRKYYLQHT